MFKFLLNKNYYCVVIQHAFLKIKNAPKYQFLGQIFALIRLKCLKKCRNNFSFEELILCFSFHNVHTGTSNQANKGLIVV